MSQSEIDEVIKNHERDTQEALRKLEQGREKQAANLRQRLADRRKQKQGELRNKHSAEVCNYLSSVLKMTDHLLYYIYGLCCFEEILLMIIIFVT